MCSIVVNLASYSMSVDIQNFLLDSTSMMVFLNKSNESISAVFTVPIEETATVYRFEYVIGGEIIHAECRERELVRS